jgi:hypothetical protein
VSKLRRLLIEACVYRGDCVCVLSTLEHLFLGELACTHSLRVRRPLVSGTLPTGD